MTARQTIDADLLKSRPLPQPDAGSKDERGRICIIGGSREVAGAVLLSSLGAMRAGAGKLMIVTVESRAGVVSVAMPEALVMGMPETPAGGLAAAPLASQTGRWAAVDAILIGPGMVEEPDSHGILKTVLETAGDAVLVVDAGALPRIRELRHGLRERAGRVIVTPHAGEMANLLGTDRRTVEADPAEAARRLTDELGLVVVMKGSETIITAPDGSWFYPGGGVGLATSGSGDVLAGIIAGLAARGAEPALASAWGVYLHGEAGITLAKEVGPIGFLARELPGPVPGLMRALQ